MDRRAFISGATSLCALPLLGTGRGLAQAPSKSAAFDELLADTIANEDLLASGRDQRERQTEEFQSYLVKAIGERKPLSSRKISDRAVDMIRVFEISSKKQYEKLYQKPTWPYGLSGVTIGIGYDVGYVNKAWLHEDWDSLNLDAEVKALEPACEVTGERAHALIPGLSNIKISFDIADAQFSSRVLPRTVSETLYALPNAGTLPNDSLGALVSLVYNRGASFKNNTDRYAEMRDIRLYTVQKKFEKIPGALRSMKRLWEGDPKMAGLVRRRELEARLFEAGLAG